MFLIKDKWLKLAETFFTTTCAIDANAASWLGTPVKQKAMARKIQLSIPEPCPQEWDSMIQVADGRFCRSCAKVVIDFSGMSDAQLFQFFKEPQGSVCGRFHQQQLAKELVMPKKPIPWLRYFFTIGLPAFLYSCKPNYTNGQPLVEPETVEEVVVGATMDPPAIESSDLQGDTVKIHDTHSTGMK